MGTLTTTIHRDHDKRFQDNRRHGNRHHDKRHHDERKSTFAVQSDGGSTVAVVVGCGVAASSLCMFAAAAFFFFGVKSKTPAQAMNSVKTKAAPHKMQDLEAAEESVGPPNDSSASSVVAPPN